jgi:hypothetical protein
MQSWRFFQSVTRQETVVDSLKEAQTFVLNIPESERAPWFAWREGFPDWVQISGCDELRPQEKPLDRRAPPPPPPPPTGTSLESMAEASAKAQAHPKIEERRQQERRKHTRYVMKLRVVVEHDQKTFRASTQDLSEGGLLLDKKVPWAMRGKLCHVFLSSPDNEERIEFNAQILSESSDPFRISFAESDEEAPFKTQLKRWLKDFEDERKKAS